MCIINFKLKPKMKNLENYQLEALRNIEKALAFEHDPEDLLQSLKFLSPHWEDFLRSQRIKNIKVNDLNVLSNLLDLYEAEEAEK